MAEILVTTYRCRDEEGGCGAAVAEQCKTFAAGKPTVPHEDRWLQWRADGSPGAWWHQTERKDQQMHHGKGADQPSVLALNPHNREASAARREKLLAAFDGLDVNTRADLLELVEAWVTAQPIDQAKRDARAIIRQVYEAAGWEIAEAVERP